MRSLTSALRIGGLLLALSAAACTSDGSSGDGTGDGDGDGDGDGSGAGGADASPVAGEELPPPDNGFQIISPAIDIGAGEEVTYCYYTTVPTDAAVGVKRWESRMTPGSHHLILYFLPEMTQPEGTITQDCNVLGGAGLNPPVWTYSAQEPDADFAMPEGIGMSVAARQPAVVQMHYFNASDQDLTAHVTINGHVYPEDATYTRAAPYITFHTGIDIPPQETSAVTGTCAVPADKQFFTMSTHSHRFSTQTRVTDGEAMVVESADWEHPDIVRWKTAPFYQFSSGSLTYQCEYYNFSNAPVQTGDSAETDEMCMAVGYFFPADKPIFCVNSTVVPF